MRRIALPVVVGAVLTGAVASGLAAHDATSPEPSRPGGVSGGEHPSGGGTEGGAMGEADGRLAKALEPVVREAEGRVSVAVQDLNSGVSGEYGREPFDSASIVKVDILAALLLQAQDEGRQLTDRERAQAAVMIEESDNESASALWRAIGGQEGLDRANERLGLTDTRGSEGRTWGLTQTTARDQLALLRAIFQDGDGGGGHSPLDADSRGYLRHLMGNVTRGQDWGVSAAADQGRFALKNGWLPRSTTDRWEVNSIGRIQADGHAYLVAVLSDGHPELDPGIAQVERAARTAVDAVRAAADDG